jgi:hypothetical protein
LPFREIYAWPQPGDPFDLIAEDDAFDPEETEAIDNGVEYRRLTGLSEGSPTVDLKQGALDWAVVEKADAMYFRQTGPVPLRGESVATALAGARH